MREFFDLISSPFVLRAMIIGVLISVCAAILGVILVLKKYSLIGHGLADVGFASTAIALAAGVAPLYVSIPVIIVASFVIMYVSQNKGIAGDTAIGVAATASLAVGIIVIYLSTGFNSDINDLMFGSIFAVTGVDIVITVILAVVVITLYILFYNRLFLITNDEVFARSAGIKVSYYQFLISFLTALTVVIGMKIIGSLLISSLIIFPAISAKQISRSFKGMVVKAGVISVFCFFAGLLLSIPPNLPIGASVVAVNVIVMILLTVVRKFKKGKA